MSRSIQRSILKKQYERFCRAWANEKRYQEFALLTGGAELVETDMKQEDGTRVRQIQENGERRNLLGRKPTFAMWLRAVKDKRVNVDPEKTAPPAEGADPKKVEVEKTDWE